MATSILAEGTSGLAAAIVMLIGATIELVRVIIQWLGNPPPGGLAARRRLRDLIRDFWKRLLFVVVLGLVGLSVLYVFTHGEVRSHQKYTTRAWKAFNKDDYEGAVHWAELCIQWFGPAAEGMQEELSVANTPLPPIGDVPDAQKKLILKRGPLNDVATCFWVKGRSLEELGRKEEARQAYEATENYTYARCWDTRGWFWSPSQDAAGRLKHIKAQEMKPSE